MLFEGESRAGKGTIKDVLVQLLGSDNVTNLRLEMFGQRFHLFSTYGKLLNVIDEIDSIEKFQEGLFKTFVGGGDMLYEMKNKNAFNGPATARVLILANEKPPIFDRSDGMWNRMLLLGFRRSFAGQENRDLPALLKTELPGIFNWALEGRKRLYERRQFTVPQISKEDKAQYKLESNPARYWIVQNVQDDSDRPIDNSGPTYPEVYERYKTYCLDNGFKPLSSIRFGREVKRVFPKATTKDPNDSEKRMRRWNVDKEQWDGVWWGIKLAPFERLNQVVVPAATAFRKAA
jgi:putative DNA primase/helicase